MQRAGIPEPQPEITTFELDSCTSLEVPDPVPAVHPGSTTDLSVSGCIAQPDSSSTTIAPSPTSEKAMSRKLSTEDSR